MRYFVIALTLFLTSCSKTTGTGLETTLRRVPDAPTELTVKARPLAPNNDKTLAGQIRDNNNNIKTYNDVAHRYNTLIDIYQCVKEAINSGKEPKCQ